MISLLAGKLIKDSKNFKNPEVRHAYGVLCGAVGVILNLILFTFKLVAGFVSGSVAVMADAFNNLSDAGSSIITLVGFKMAGKKPDPDHPFGHGRIEYVTGLVVSMIIIIMGFELLKSSFDKIRHPEELVYSTTAIAILIVSVFIKLYMYAYNKNTSEKIASSAMNATAMDSFTDSIATSVVLLSMLIGYFTGINIDGWCGLLVSGFVLYAGITSAKDTLDPLLGSKPSKEYVDMIEKYVSSNEGILGVHDLVVHDYGPGRVMISLHAEVSASGDVLELHDTIDNIERRLNEVLGCQAVIHMDPVVVNDEVTDRMKRLCYLIAKSVDESLNIHDFRMVKGPTHTNLIFDVVVPYDCKFSEEEVQSEIERKIVELPGNHFGVIQVDRPFV